MPQALPATTRFSAVPPDWAKIVFGSYHVRYGVLHINSRDVLLAVYRHKAATGGSYEPVAASYLRMMVKQEEVKKILATVGKPVHVPETDDEIIIALRTQWEAVLVA